ncbi:small GTP-binding protein, putative [Trichomonas vaginalis G3]|uniref:Small GTP-binding protein, putative n=1 Tax=Trichomonas vaginalis (strain ATCC PRA-98 / G3) TaxID=412133 RepID=A2FEU4_TRIV3|nr:small GTPase mediated signal transduction [Trichomonas vaginalis G3]EAX96591.1 small GTP-binding protein, putative [Trichomonas vaginalis G3]KAI5485921.1 small GTPase mediated signal transduction [Trichomonas vaginalis G3]|eukprot:XP_001309521.1 small GTP-binding protein [Trichomonas vaginalis G3]
MQPKNRKISFVGDASVGKTSIINRRVKGSFQAELSSTIGSSHVKCMEDVDGKKVELSLWDTAGQEKYHSLVPLYTRDSDIILICAALNDEDSINNIEKWLKIAEQVDTAVPFIVINKCDLEVPDADTIKSGLAEKYKHIYFISALSGEGFNELFYDVANDQINKEAIQESETVALAGDPKEKSKKDKKSGCC